MNDTNKKIKQSVVPVSIDKELKASFLDYAMSVIISRALPDVRDGLKPVHRRILYAMHNLGLYKERPYKKSASVVGEVIAKFHPHGDSPIYQAMVGLVQDFAKRYPLLDGQGNWGSIDGDEAAAFRYTEIRMDKIARELLTDIEKESVDFVPNFDESCMQPVILPSKVPQLLVNGSNGIAVGMATSIPPHNIGETLDACIAILHDPLISDSELFKIIPAPDFPGGGVICGLSNVVKAYKTGHGSVRLRGVVDIVEEGGKPLLIIKEIPYQVNKADLITKIADLAKNKVIEGISNIRDESSRKGIRVVIELKKNEISQVVLNQIYKHTSLETSVSMNLLAVLNNRPMIFTLREILQEFINHRKVVITRRSEFDLAKNKKREHVLQGLIVALGNIDSIIKTIKSSDNAVIASENLQKLFNLSEIQSKAILDMKLQKITSLEGDKIKNEMLAIQQDISFLESILNNQEVLSSEVLKELEKIKEDYADERRTKIDPFEGSVTDLDLIPNDEVVITLTKKGYIKRVKAENYAVQHRGGKGKKGTADLSENDDLIQEVVVAQNHDNLLFFTNKGRVYSYSAFQIPEGSRIAKGRAIVNLLQLQEDESILKMLKVDEVENKYLMLVTKFGVTKKTPLSAFAKVRANGIIALGLRDEDELAFCGVTDGESSILLATSKGQGIRFNEAEIRPMGRQAAGVRGIRLKEGDHVVGLEVVSPQDLDCTILFATSKGYGKQVLASDFRVAHRGGLGVKTIPVDFRNGDVIGMVRVPANSTLFMIDNGGKIMRILPEEIRTMRRGAKGVRLIKLDKNQKLSSIVSFAQDDSQDEVEQVENMQAVSAQEEVLSE